MSNDGRYEIKLVLDEGKFTEFLNWMYHSTGAMSTYEPRYVNSLYFDDVGYQSVRDNLAGISERKKMRLRWYHKNDSSEISSLVLEMKYRIGRLGYKKKYPLPGLQAKLMDMDIGSIYDGLVDEIGISSAAGSVLFDDCFFPSLQVSYLRDYFEDINGLRITLDREINFLQGMPHFKLKQDISAPYPMTVAELKFPPEIKPAVINALRNLHMTPKRHSKYLIGLSIFGQAIYI